MTRVHRPLLHWLAAFALALAMTLPGASVPFSNTAESQEALVVWEMVESRDWVLPRVNGELIPSKPPLFHWIAVGFSALTGGVNELAVRLPSIVCAAAAVGLVYVTGSTAWGPVAGSISAVALATSPEWAKWATTARTDASFALFLTAALLCGERWLRSGRTPLLVSTAAFTGAATLAKGFAGAALVGLVMLVELWRRGDWRRLRVGPLAASAVVFVALAVSWYAAALAHAGFDFFHKQIVLENVLRFLPYEEGGPSRKHGAWFYLPMLFTGMLPWSLALPHALWRGFRARSGDELAGYLISWFAVVFLVCTAASGKRTNYLLPIYPAAALLVGRMLGLVLEDAATGSRRPSLAAVGWLAAAIVGMVAGLLLAWWLGFQPWGSIVPWLHPQDRVLFPQMIALIGRPHPVAIVVAAALSIALAAATVARAWKALAASIGGALVVLTTVVGLTVSRLESDLKSFAPFTSRVAGAVGQEPLAFYRAPDFAVLFYLRRHARVERGAFTAMPHPGWGLVWQKDWDALSPSDRDGVQVADQSPPASVGRLDTRLLLVRLRGRLSQS
jgi:4-amino-4-deoxy-L-arabinose transferase-like glycosyltransferase